MITEYLPYIASFILGVVVTYIFIKITKEGSIKKDVSGARESLRKLHKKYQQEFFEVNDKIDKYLETLESDNSKGGND